jgi:anaerobic magnesium-protoporphyrin IX monomethyl ester cyclase
MTLKVLLVGINSKFVHSNLALRYLKAYTQDLDYECILKESSINDRIENILEGIMKEKPDMVAFSCYIWNIEIVKALAKLIKLINENIEIIYGGPEVSHNGREYLEKHVGEYLIEGEGEDIYRKLIENKLSLNKQSIETENLSKIGGLFYKIDGVLADDMLNDEGNAFSKYYFDFDKGQYLKDYENLFAAELPTLYHVSDSWRNYDRLKEIIDLRYSEWKKSKKKKKLWDLFK